MKVKVEHEIPDDPVYCWDGDTGGWYVACKYIKHRDRTGKVGTPIQRRLPRCTLFEEWLKEVGRPVKCPACLRAMEEARKEAQNEML